MLTQHFVLLLRIFRRSSKDIVLDDDDLELIHENKSINQDKLVSFCFFITSPAVYF